MHVMLLYKWALTALIIALLRRVLPETNWPELLSNDFNDADFIVNVFIFFFEKGRSIDQGIHFQQKKKKNALKITNPSK